MFDLDAQLVTVAVFHNEAEFLLARGRLESAGIECVALNENVARIGGWHAHGGEGIKLQVWQAEYEDALAVLHHSGAEEI